MTDDATATALAAWRDTWFGDPGGWPPSLAAAARDCLALAVPATLAWGPDFRLLYNQAYADLLDDQHPSVRGRPAWEPAAAMWEVVGPMLHRVRATGETQRGERVALARDTPDGRRTHWYSWTYSPVWCDGRVEGVFAVIRDDTTDELATQHERACAAATRVATSDDVPGALVELVAVLGTLPDVRFAACHRLGPDGSWHRLGHAGPELRRPTATSLLDHAEATGRWPVPATPELRETVGPAVVRSPDVGSHLLRASWSAVAVVRGDIVALTVGFVPLIGDAHGHRPFVEYLVREISSPRPASSPSRPW